MRSRFTPLRRGTTRAQYRLSLHFHRIHERGAHQPRRAYGLDVALDADFAGLLEHQ
jgi:hypothetical protein